MNNDSPIIEIDNLTRRYGKTDAVNGLSLKVQAGKCYGFFGRNGAGKTTTIKCLLNLLRPDSGTARVFGLDPIVRREFIETVIGAYQSGDPGRRTVFVSTHLISEFEGLIDEFTIIEQGRELLTMEADAARERFRKINARFAIAPAQLALTGALNVKQNGREVEVLANGNSEQLLAELKSRAPEELRCESLSLEEIFVASDILKKAKT